MFSAAIFSLFLHYFPLCCQSAGRNNEAETHKISFTGTNNDLLLHTNNRTEQLVDQETGSGSKLVKILDSHDLSRRHDVDQISGGWLGGFIGLLTCRAKIHLKMRFYLFIFYILISPFGTLYFLLSDVEEFVFSSWYFLIFYIIKSSSGSLPTNISSLSAEIANKLADKLSVSSSVFIINNIHKADH